MSKTDRERKNRQQMDIELKKKMLKPNKAMGSYVKEYLVLMVILFPFLLGATLLLWDYPIWQWVADAVIILIGWLVWLKIREVLERRAEKIRRMRERQRELLKKAKDKTDRSITADYVSVVKNSKASSNKDDFEELEDEKVTTENNEAKEDSAINEATIKSEKQKTIAETKDPMPKGERKGGKQKTEDAAAGKIKIKDEKQDTLAETDEIKETLQKGEQKDETNKPASKAKATKINKNKA